MYSEWTKTGDRKADIIGYVKPVCDAYGVECEYLKDGPYSEYVVLDGERLSISGTSVEYILIEVTAWILCHVRDFKYNKGFFYMRDMIYAEDKYET
ncbi:MAG: hypothetical protein LUD47_00520 [Clostridia bacterium]|nr:hypothetical protein [Clostridia bacterium]